MSIPEDERLLEFNKIQDKYFNIASKVDEMLQSNIWVNETITNTTINNSSVTSDLVENKRRLKLPIAEVPKFNGDYDEWLTYKNTFKSMIDSRDDLTAVEKFLHLQSTLKGEALSTISIYSVSSENYDKAWKLLEESYEFKKIIVSRHLQVILNLPVIEKESYNVLIKLAKEARQHVGALESLNISIGSEMLAQIIENKLPKSMTDGWDKLIGENEVPQFTEICDFITSVALRLAKNVKPDIQTKKREKLTKTFHYPDKKPKYDKEKLSFLAHTSNNCIFCKDQQHPLYRCQNLKKLTVSRRIDVVKGAKLCYNCLHQHRGSCTLSNCTVCNKRHNTLLNLSRSDKEISSENKDLKGHSEVSNLIDLPLKENTK